MNSAGEAFGFPFRSPSWLGTVLLQGLILIIPIIGQIALFGWLLLTLDNLRAGRQELAPAGFHLGRGIGLFGVQLIYAIVLFILPGILEGVGAGLAQNNGGAGGALIGLSVLLYIIAAVLLAFVSPALYLLTSERGFSGGMDVGSVWRLATSNVGNTVIAALLFIVAHFIASLGAILCGVGALFTTVYAYGVIAGIVDWYRRVQTQQVPFGPSPAV